MKKNEDVKKQNEVKVSLINLENEKLSEQNLKSISGGSRCGVCHEDGGNPDPESRLLNNQGTVE